MQTVSAEIVIDPQQAIPQNGQGRAEWLEKFGPQPKEAMIEIVGSAADWESIGELNVDGTAGGSYWRGGGYFGSSSASGVRHAVKWQILEEIKKTGKTPTEWPLSSALQEYLREEEDRKREIEKRDRESKERSDAFRREFADWVSSHGSDRLKRLVAAKIDCEAVYRDERRAWIRAQLPERWCLDRDFANSGGYEVPRNAPVEALDLLDRAKQFAPDAALQYAKVDWDDEEDMLPEEIEGRPKYQWTGYVALAQLHGERIVFGAPEQFVSAE